MSQQTLAKKTFWGVFIFYFIIAFEFFYMASPFAIYFYSLYAPGLRLLNKNPVLSWLTTVFLPHYIKTSNILVNLHNIIGMIIALLGFSAFCIGAIQVYYHKLAKKGAVMGGIYNIIRHPQYTSFAICSFGLLLIWPRYIVLLSFIAVLFAYYFLAKVEERECEEKFGQAYIDYKNKTCMFIPVKLPFKIKFPKLPENLFFKIVIIVFIYIMISVVSIGLAAGIRTVSINSIYGVYDKSNASIFIDKINRNDLKRIVDIALNDNNVNKKLEPYKNQNSKFLNYILPVTWHNFLAGEIPMNPITEETINNKNKNLYKMIITKAIISGDQNTEGKRILFNAVDRIPIAEIWIDVDKNMVVQIKNMPEKLMFKNIPVPLI